MIEPSARVDKALGINLRKVYSTVSGSAIRRADRKDTLTISRFSSLVERVTKRALELPDIRADRVREARAGLTGGNAPRAEDIASAMLDPERMGGA